MVRKTSERKKTGRKWKWKRKEYNGKMLEIERKKEAKKIKVIKTTKKRKKEKLNET